MRRIGIIPPALVPEMARELIARADRLMLPGAKELDRPEIKAAIQEISQPRKLAQ